MPCITVATTQEESENTKKKKTILTQANLKLLISKVFLAGVTRLELATSSVTGQRSNQLSYTPELLVGDERLELPTLSV